MQKILNVAVSLLIIPYAVFLFVIRLLGGQTPWADEPLLKIVLGSLGTYLLIGVIIFAIVSATVHVYPAAAIMFLALFALSLIPARFFPRLRRLEGE